MGEGGSYLWAPDRIMWCIKNVLDIYHPRTEKQNIAVLLLVTGQFQQSDRMTAVAFQIS